MSARRTNLVAVVVLVLALVGVLLWDRLGADGPASRDGAARVDPDRDAGRVDAARERAVGAQVRALGRAWDARDREAFVAAAGSTDAAQAFGTRTYDALEALDVRDVALRLVTTSDGPAPGLADAAVGVSWTPDPGTGPAVATEEVEVGLSMRQTGDGWAVEDVSATTDPLPVWLAGTLDVVAVDGARLVGVAPGDGDATPQERLAGLVADGAEQVRATLTRSGRDPLVVAPAETAVAAELLGEAPDALAQLAAVTTTPDGRADVATGSVVVLNPGVFDRLDEADARLVVTHELVHALSDVSAGDAPLWVVEGFADWVALRDDARPPREVAAGLLEQVRASGPPAALPDARDFDARSDGLGATYEAAWTLFEVLESEGDADDVVDFYDAVRDGEPVADALEQRFDLTEDELVARWQAWLRQRAG